MTQGARATEMPPIAVLREWQERRRVEPREHRESDGEGTSQTRAALWLWRPM